MLSIRDKYITCLSLLILCYLVYRVDNYLIPLYYDHMFLNIVLFILWYITFSYRSFVMTKSRLSGYYSLSDLEYKYLTLDDKIHRIYVRVSCSNDWYELDYDLTLPRDCSYPMYNEFIRKNITVGDLLSTMEFNLNDLEIGNRYRLRITNYDTFKYMSLIFLLIFVFIYILLYIR